jgi:sugar/nucleoside kinase (ribokinase family)
MIPEYVTLSNLIIDDIVLADGRSFMNTLGGAGTHTLLGMRPWSKALGFVAYCGDDFEAQHRTFLEDLSVDLRGIIRRPGLRTARAWQLFEPDERRIEIFRTSLEEFILSKPQFEEIPPDYLQARGYHIQWGSLDELAIMLTQLHTANPDVKIAYEPSISHLAGSLAAHGPILSQIDLFTPDREEAGAITGTTDVPGMIDTLLNAGARLVALRMGAAGSLVGTSSGDYYRIPAVPPSKLVDVTGAGNAYCGGFIVGLGRNEEPAYAAARAAASASFALEQIGIPLFDDEKTAQAEHRRVWALDHIQHSRSITTFMPISEI